MYRITQIGIVLILLIVDSMAQINSVAWQRYYSLGKGVNAQGWLTHIFETNTSGYIEYTEADFQQMRAYGFDHVRLKVDYAHWMDLDTILNVPVFPYETDSTILLYTDTGISYCLNNGLICVLDYYNWSWDSAMLNSSNYLQTAPILGKQWKTIADRYKNLPADSLLYEIYNEPGGVGATEMRIAFKTIIDSIRTVDTVHTIIVWGQVDDYTLLGDNNIILTVHHYEPHFFANQGKTFGNNSFNTTGVPFPYDSVTMPLQNPLDTGSSYLTSLYNSYPNKGTMAYVDNWIQALKVHADSLNVPLYIGEFGCTNRSPAEGMVNYLEAVRKAFESHGIPWAIYNWKNKNSSFFSMFNCDGCFNTDSLFTDSTGYTILCALGLDSCANTTGFSTFEVMNDRIDLFPNPATATLGINVEWKKSVQIQIFSLSGELLADQKQLIEKTIDVSSLKRGGYIIVIENGETVFFEKFIKL